MVTYPRDADAEAQRFRYELSARIEAACPDARVGWMSSPPSLRHIRVEINGYMIEHIFPWENREIYPDQEGADGFMKILDVIAGA